MTGDLPSTTTPNDAASGGFTGDRPAAEPASDVINRNERPIPPALRPEPVSRRVPRGIIAELLEIRSIDEM
jgi:hypothetical protein